MRWWPTYVSRMWSLRPRRACTAAICSSPLAMARLLKGSLYLETSMCAYRVRTGDRWHPVLCLCQLAQDITLHYKTLQYKPTTRRWSDWKLQLATAINLLPSSSSKLVRLGTRPGGKVKKISEVVFARFQGLGSPARRCWRTPPAPGRITSQSNRTAWQTVKLAALLTCRKDKTSPNDSEVTPNWKGIQEGLFVWG